MPAIPGGDLTTLRSYPQTVKRYLSVAPRTPVFQATVSAVQTDSDSGGIHALEFNTVTLGAYGDIESGMAVDIGTTPGARNIGTARVRKPAASDTLYPGVIAAGDLPVQVGHYITVVEHYPLAAKTPRMVKQKTGGSAFYNDFTLYVDYDQAYSDENTNIRPIPNIDAQPAGFVDAGQTYRTVVLDASNSESFNGVLTYNWSDLADGTIIVGTSSDATITVQFPDSDVFRYITLEVTDNIGKTAKKRFPIFVHNETNPPITNLAITRDETEIGREMTAEVFGPDSSVDADVIPEGALVIYWELAEFDGTAAPDSYRDQFMGWVGRDAVRIQLHDRSLYTLEILGSAAWLDRLGGIALTLTALTPPTSWLEHAAITTKHLALYLLRNFSTFVELCNFEFLSNSALVGEHTTTQGSLLAQIQPIANAWEFGQARCDSMGGFYIRRHASHRDTSGRASVANILTLTNADWPDDPGLTVSREPIPREGWLKGAGAVYLSPGKSKPYACRAPGGVPGKGVSWSIGPLQFLSGVSSQTLLNRIIGHHYAWLNNEIPELTVELVGNLDVFEPAWGEWVTIDEQNPNIRDLSLADKRFLVKRVSITHSNNHGEPPKRITVTLEAETEGEPARTEPIIEENYPQPTWPPYEDLWPAVIEYPPDAPGVKLDAVTFYAADALFFRRKWTLADAWETIFNVAGVAGAGWYMLDVQPDYFAPGESCMILLGHTTSGTRIYGTTNLSAATPTWTLLQSLSPNAIRGFISSYYSMQDVWVCYVQDLDDGIFVKTTDRFTTFTPDPPQVIATGRGPSPMAFCITGHATNYHDGLMLVGAYNGSKGVLRRSLDFGDTWGGQLGPFPDSYPPILAMLTWLGNEDEQEFFVAGGTGALEDGFLYVTTNGGVSFQDVTPQYNGYKYGIGARANRYGRLLHGFAPNNNLMAFAGKPSRDNYGEIPFEFFWSSDRGRTWERRSGFVSDPHQIGGWPLDPDVLFAHCEDRLLLTQDGGYTWERIEWEGYDQGVWGWPVW